MPAESNFRFVDIGSGLGGVLVYLAKVRPDGFYTGVESAPLPFFYSWLRLKIKGCRYCEVVWGDFWQSHLGDYDIVFAYLSPAPMSELWQKAKTEMRPGTLFISSTFNVPDQSPAETIPISDLHRSVLRVWRM